MHRTARSPFVAVIAVAVALSCALPAASRWQQAQPATPAVPAAASSADTPPAASSPAAAQQPAQGAATVHLRGRIVAWDGKPIAGAGIALAPSDSLATATLLSEPPQRTGADGSFDLQAPALLPQDKQLVLLIAQKGMASIARYPRWNYDKAKRPAKQAAANARRPQPVKDTDLGEIVLPEGARLFGRVRDADGKPIAGAEIVARDMLENHRTLPGSDFDCYCRAISDGSGIFQLSTTLPSAVAIEVKAAGFYRAQQECVSVGTPLEFTLQKSGLVSGRLLDAEGRGVGEAWISANYERRGNSERVRTEADGSFRMSLDHAARYRLTAQHTDANGRAQSGHSEVLEGPRANLEFTLDKKDKANDGEAITLTVRAIAKATGQPVAVFRAAAVFEDYANRNPNYLEYRFSPQFYGWTDAADGSAQVPGPSKGNVTVGAVRVLAEGFAPATKKDVEAKEPEGDKPLEPIAIELIAESTLQGKVVDETTGAPIAGAQVWAVARPDPNQSAYDSNIGTPEDAVTTAADGSYTLHQLGEGSWQVRVQHPQRPRVPAENLDLGVTEQKTGFDLKLPAGAVVEGRVTGMPIPQGTRVFLQELPKFQFQNGGGYYRFNSNGNSNVPDNAVPLASDGAFTFKGIKLESYVLMLMLPSPPRCGGNVMLPLEPFRVRKDGERHDIAADDDQPGALTGRVKFTAAAAPLDRLVVTAQQVVEDQQNVFYGNQQFPGPRSFVAADGTFSVRVGPGSYKLVLVDIGTGIALANSKTDLKVRAGGSASGDLEAALATVRVKLLPEEKDKPMALVDRVELRHMPTNSKQQVFGNDNYEQGYSIGIAPGQTEFECALPAGTAQFFARNNIAQVRIDDQRWNVPPIGRLEVEVKVEGAARIESELKIGAPPETVDPNAKKDGDGEADDSGDVKQAKPKAIKAKIEPKVEKKADATDAKKTDAKKDAPKKDEAKVPAKATAPVPAAPTTPAAAEPAGRGGRD